MRLADVHAGVFDKGTVAMSYAFSWLLLAQQQSEGTNPWLIVVVALLAGFMGMGFIKLLGYLRKLDAKKRKLARFSKMRRSEAAARHKEAEVEAKELRPPRKTRIEDQLNDSRRKLFERERHLDKQQDLIESRADQLQKQEKMVENDPRKLANELRMPTAARRNSTICSTSNGKPSTKSAASAPKTPRPPACSNGSIKSSLTSKARSSSRRKKRSRRFAMPKRRKCC